jgi:hypothetical protein
MSWCRAPLWGPWPDFTFSFLLSENCFSLLLGRPLGREDGSAICSAICQWSESRRTRNHTLLSPLRLLGSLSVASCDSQRLRRKYSYPPPHGSLAQSQSVTVTLRLTVSQSVRLGVEPTLRLLTRVCFFKRGLVWKFLSCLLGAPSTDPRRLINCLEADPSENTDRNNACLLRLLVTKEILLSGCCLDTDLRKRYLGSDLVTCGSIPWKAPTLVS